MEEYDLIWIQDAVKEFQRSLYWLQEQVRQRHLKAYRIPGERKQYLSGKEVRDLIQPREWHEKI